MTTIPPHYDILADLSDAARVALTLMADVALETGEHQIAIGLLAIPDVIIVKGLQDGLEPLPDDTPMLVRPDGRYVAIFREPGRSAA